jgi:hypothetical protein
MSSGDESDDADLTDGDSSENDWTDIDGLTLCVLYPHEIHLVYRVVSRK